MPLGLDSNKYKILQSASEFCTVKLYLEACMEIKMNWHHGKIQSDN
tara:strand:- start:122 stop:259 length:138 start_codon:yes stop_codon:yes gene_type:complete